MHNYHESLNTFPAGWISRPDAVGENAGPGWCWATLSLAFCEQSARYSSINFADGSVRMIKARRPLPLFQALATRAGGEVVSDDAL